MINKEENSELSAEELKARKDEMMAFYVDSMPYLKAQLEYEETLLKIDEARFKRTSTQIQYAMLVQESQNKDTSKTKAETTNKKS